MDVILFVSLFMIVSDRVNLQGVVLYKNSEGFIKIRELWGFIVVDFNEGSVEALQI